VGTDLERQAAIGRAVLRLIELGLEEELVRPGLEALAQYVLGQLGADFREEAAERGLVVGSVDDVELSGQGTQLAPPSADAGSPGDMVTDVEDPVRAAAEVRRRARVESVPMERSALLALLDSALRDTNTVQPGVPSPEPIGVQGREALNASSDYGYGGPAPHIGEELDSALPGVVTRTRLRAQVTRAIAARVRTDAPIDDTLLHKSRSEGASLWMTDLLDPDPIAVDTLAECLDAVADAVEMVVFLDTYEPANRVRRAQAVKDVAAVQSALRIATAALRATPDDDQLAIFRWCAAVTKDERIFVERHMRLTDPLDPAEISDVVAPIHADLEQLKERATRDAARKKGFNKLKYLAHQIESGKHTPQDPDKLADAITTLVADAMPESSPQFREVLLPILEWLPSSEGRSPAYVRVIRELNLHRARLAQALTVQEERRAEAADADDALADSVSSPTDAVRLARERLGRLAIPDSATETTDEIDHAVESAAWGRTIWRALQALHIYATQSAEYGGFWDWCENSGHAQAWPASNKKLAMNESQTAMNAYGEDRVFKVDTRVRSSGKIVMEAHFKIAEGGGAFAPRIYFHDDTKGATGLVHIGFIGAHHHMRNASTN